MAEMSPSHWKGFVTVMLITAGAVIVVLPILDYLTTKAFGKTPTQLLTFKSAAA